MTCLSARSNAHSAALDTTMAAIRAQSDVREGPSNSCAAAPGAMHRVKAQIDQSPTFS